MKDQYARAIKNFVDGFFNGTIHFVTNENDVSAETHSYDIATIMGFIRYLVYEGMDIDFPPKKGGIT